MISLLGPLLQLSSFGQILDRPLSGGPEIGFWRPVPKRSFLYCGLYCNCHVWERSWTNPLPGVQTFGFRDRSQNGHFFITACTATVKFWRDPGQTPFRGSRNFVFETGPKTVISLLRPVLQLSSFGQILDRSLSGGPEIGFLRPV